MQLLRKSRQSEYPQTLLFSCPEMEYVAKGLMTSDLLQDSLIKGEISWGKFNDDFPNIFINNSSAIAGRDVVFLASLNGHYSFFAQLSVLYNLPRYLAKSLTVILPYLPTGKTERIDEEGQILMSMTVPRLLSCIPITQSGPAKVVVFDIHTLQARFYFRDSVVPFLVTAIPQFISRLTTSHKEEKLAIAFPDEGAWKRFHVLFKEWEVITCTRGNNQEIRIIEGNPENKHVFIVDDLVKTGNTLLACKNVLYSKGAKAVSAYVTHALFPGDAWKVFVDENEKPFHYFYLTDSQPLMAKQLQHHKPFVVLSLVPALIQLLADQILHES